MIDPQTISEQFQAMLIAAISMIPRLISTAVVFIITLYLAGLIARVTLRSMEARQVNTQAALLLARLLKWSVIVLGTTMALQQVGFNLTAFLTSLGIAGFTIGFALQDVSKNFVSGMLLLIQKPFEIGDMIEVTGFTGNVVAIDLRATAIRTQDGRLVLIPSADVFTNPITNLSRVKTRRVEIVVNVPYEIDLDNVRSVTLQAIGSLPGVIQEPPPKAYLQNFTGSNVEVVAQYWIDNALTDVVSQKDAGLAALKLAFDQAGIRVPEAQTFYMQAL